MKIKETKKTSELPRFVKNIIGDKDFQKQYNTEKLKETKKTSELPRFVKNIIGDKDFQRQYTEKYIKRTSFTKVMSGGNKK